MISKVFAFFVASPERVEIQAGSFTSYFPPVGNHASGLN